MESVKCIRNIINEDFLNDLDLIMKEHKFCNGLTMKTVMKEIRDGTRFVGIKRRNVIKS